MDDWEALRARHTVLADDAVLVLDKPAGLAVMGERHGSDLVRIAAEAGETLYPVHRIDKVTSGAVLLARDLGAHGGLTRQFARGTAGKAYLAVVTPAGLPERGTIDLPLSVGRKNRVRVAAPRAAIVTDGQHWSADPAQVYDEVRTYPSRTVFSRVWDDGEHALLLVRPVTGRRHQIRVHLAWAGHPVLGDPLFGTPDAPRTHLHSWRVEFDADWLGGTRLRAEAAPGADFWAPLEVSLPGGSPAAVLATARRVWEGGLTWP
ncbi:MAG TPA: RNA pseudouridine synthase [Streptosporangiaceae bacterium]|nr:RNA pseudouridine synthase [Streptosporangiaceae bacterium]